MTARKPISRCVETQLGPSDMIGVMHPLDSIDSVRMTRNHSIISRAIQQFRGRKGNYHAAERIRAALRELPGRNGRADPQSGVAQRHQGADRPHGRVEGGPQGAHSGQRGLLEHPAAAAARSDRLDARPRQSEARQRERRPERSQRGPLSLLRRTGPRVLHAGRLRGGEPEQRRRSIPSIRAGCPSSSSTSTSR